MKNILLFGSEGLIGNNFYNFLKKKYNVICVDFKDTNKKKIYNADVTDEKSLRNLFKKIELKYKRIHCVVNTAHIQEITTFQMIIKNYYHLILITIYQLM